MGDISFFVKRDATAPPEELWESLVAGTTGGWPLLQRCRSVQLGEPVLFTLPHPHGGEIASSGRIIATVPGRSITIAQESPWECRIRMTLAPQGTGSSVRVDVTLGEDCLSWFHAGIVNGERTPLSASTLKVGLLVCLSGATGILGRSVANAAAMGVDELNEMGAFGKRRAELVVADDKTSPIAARDAFLRLAEVERCDVIIASVSSASMDGIRPHALERQTLFLYTAMSERGEGGRNFFQFGETPMDQLWTSIPTAMKDSDSRNWFILGSDYVWPRSVGMAAHELITKHDGRIAGEHYQSLGSTQFDEVIDAIASSGADLILSSLVGIDAVLFEREFYDSGHRSEFRTLATNFDDSVLEHIGRDESVGIWSVQDYFMPTLADEMDDVARRYRQQFGELAPKLTSMAKGVYDSLHLYAQAVQVAKSVDAADVSAVLRAGTIGGSRLRSRAAGRLTPTHLAEVTQSGFREVRSGSV